MGKWGDGVWHRPGRRPPSAAFPSEIENLSRKQAVRLIPALPIGSPVFVFVGELIHAEVFCLQ